MSYQRYGQRRKHAVVNVKGGSYSEIDIQNLHRVDGWDATKVVKKRIFKIREATHRTSGGTGGHGNFDEAIRRQVVDAISWKNLSGIDRTTHDL